MNGHRLRFHEQATARAIEMEHAYRDGKTLREVGAAYGISHERVRQILKRRGVTRFDRPHPIEVAARKQREADHLDEIAARWSEATYLACLHDGGPGGRLCDECRDLAVAAPYDVNALIVEVQRVRARMMDAITAAFEEGYTQGVYHPKGVSVVKRRREVTLAFLQRLAEPGP